MSWHRKTGASLLLRMFGASLLALAWLAAMSLRRHALAGPVDGDPLAFLLAAANFLSGSAGALLASLGAHIFDRVELAERWMHRPADPDI